MSPSLFSFSLGVSFFEVLSLQFLSFLFAVVCVEVLSYVIVERCPALLFLALPVRAPVHQCNLIELHIVLL